VFLFFRKKEEKEEDCIYTIFLPFLSGWKLKIGGEDDNNKKRC